MKAVIPMVGLVLAGTALAQQASPLPLPSETDLRSAYCLAVWQAEYQSIQETLNSLDTAKPSGMSQQSYEDLLDSGRHTLANIQERIARGTAYLKPRVPSLDPVALQKASSAGSEDLKKFTNAMANNQLAYECVKQRCGTNVDSDAFQACVNGCAGQDVIDLRKRVQLCSDPAFLPY